LSLGLAGRTVEPMFKRSSRVFAALGALVLLPVAATSCAAVVSALPTVIAYAQDAAFILDQVAKFVDAYLAVHPDAALQKRVSVAEARARSALDLALRTATGAQDLDQAKIDAAFSDFRLAWQDYLVLVGPMGVTAGAPRLAAAPSGGLLVPDPLAAVRR
jgi:hypothetical protein